MTPIQQRLPELDHKYLEIDRQHNKHEIDIRQGCLQEAGFSAPQWDSFPKRKNLIMWSSVDTSLTKPFTWEQGWIEQRGSRRELTPGPARILFHWIFIAALWSRWYYHSLPNQGTKSQREDVVHIVLPYYWGMKAGSELQSDSEPGAFPISPRIPSRKA